MDYKMGKIEIAIDEQRNIHYKSDFDKGELLEILEFVKASVRARMRKEGLFVYDPKLEMPPELKELKCKNIRS